MVINREIDGNVCIKIAQNNLTLFDYSILEKDKTIMILKYLNMMFRKEIKQEARMNLYQSISNIIKTNLVNLQNNLEEIWLGYIECSTINYKISIDNQYSDMPLIICQEIDTLLKIISSTNILSDNNGQRGVNLWNETLEISDRYYPSFSDKLQEIANNQVVYIEA